MTKDDIEHLWKIASNDPNHDSNWFDPVIIKFAGLIEEKKQKEVDRLTALCEEMLSELYVYRASEYLKDTTAAIRARGQQ